MDIDFAAEVELEALLGRGAFGAVYRGRWRRAGGRAVAVKMLHNVGGAEELAAFQSEVAVLSRLAHPCIVRFLGACLAPPHACMLEELVEGGSLHSFLHGCVHRAQWRRKNTLLASMHRPPHAHAFAKACRAALHVPGAAVAGGRHRQRDGVPAPDCRASVRHACLVCSLAALTSARGSDLKSQNVLLDHMWHAKVRITKRAHLLLCCWL